MSLLVSNTNGASADYVGKTNIVGNPNIRAAHTICARMRWTGTTNILQYNVGFGANADQSGTYLNRTTSDGASDFYGRRYNSTLSASDNAVMSGAYSGTSAWHHYAITYDATNIRSYLDGVLKTTTASATTRTSNTSTCNFFWALAGTYMMADVAFFARALTADELLLLAAGRLAPVLSKGDCFGFFPCHFDSRLKDYSGVGNDASDFAGTGSAPAADNEGVPLGWIPTRTSRLIIPNPYVLFSSGTSISPTAATGTLQGKIRFTGANDSVSPTSATGTLQVRIPFTAGSSVSVSAATATLAARIPFTAGLATSTSAATGTLTGKPTYAGTSLSVSAATGTLNVRKPFTTGTADTTTAAVGEIEAQARFTSGAADSVTAATGTIQARVLFTVGDCYSRSAAEGGLTQLGSVSFAGVSDTTSAATGSLRASREFSGACLTPSAASGTLQVRVNVSGTCLTPGTSTGTLRVYKHFAGTCITTSAARGQLSGGTVINPIQPDEDRRRQERRRMSLNAYRRRIR